IRQRTKARGNMRPIIGITVARETKKGSAPREVVRTTYVDAVQKSGGIPCLLPNLLTSGELLQHCDGLLLTGGGDFSPQTYAQEMNGTLRDSISVERDETELALIAQANRLDMPIFGICRGIQAMVIAEGGSLIQDIPSTFPHSSILHKQVQPREIPTHSVSVTMPESRLRRLVAKDRLIVNSFHHQAVDVLPERFVVTAQADDGIIEAVEALGERFYLGVQWHPEDLAPTIDWAQALFDDFVAQAALFHARRTAE
ncbi:MAG: gamma-glutamyl-gamma-aminobutyrate hydrolase family protein, partial [Firmicutes bacterium]|nr:gamma-glutamyl-gamma-aminobutyrate hydrolase family protein [Bacillota bacterium]